ncbi:hypothetical protein [Chryseobacterium sp. SIMBA_038]|uniref:hypothetical protein n=1 Tax=Chryseobacterium sp. SIMBA_038 TaxID=3085780 RepID=UPI00397DE32D
MFYLLLNRKKVNMRKEEQFQQTLLRKTVVITGSSSGVRRTAAEDFALEGSLLRKSIATFGFPTRRILALPILSTNKFLLL